jgi:hypothetical protein
MLSYSQRYIDMSALTELYQQIALCHKCDIAKLRTKVVPGEGAENADIIFIGEAPGWHEDQQGRPFSIASRSILPMSSSAAPLITATPSPRKYRTAVNGWTARLR